MLLLLLLAVVVVVVSSHCCVVGSTWLLEQWNLYDFCNLMASGWMCWKMFLVVLFLPVTSGHQEAFHVFVGDPYKNHQLPVLPEGGALHPGSKGIQVRERVGWDVVEDGRWVSCQVLCSTRRGREGCGRLGVFFPPCWNGTCWMLNDQFKAS